ncbi:MAG TPA: EamA family transporter [Anaerolineales bacterium]|nr:EamA family transporter [Anaerolineales bacterium]
MPNIAIFLVTISAFAHAFWNLLGKRQNPSTAFFFLASALAALCLSPILFIYHEVFALIPARVWLWVGLTSIFEAIYYIGLAGAYRHGDLSVAYPLARALPVILVALLTAIFSLGDPLSLVGAAGIFLVAIGCLLLPIRNLRQIQMDRSLVICCLLAGLAALGTTGYTLVDNQALFELRTAPGIGLSRIELAFFYLALCSFTITLVVGLYILFSPFERSELGKTLQSGKGMAFVTGILIVGTYGLVLAAMQYAGNVSYIAAFRQLSIPLGAILGVLVQREAAYPIKLASIGIIFAGLVLIILA